MNLLIVDDDPLICKSLHLTLSKEPDMTIQGIAQNGTEALSLCEKAIPDMILMDIRMPHVDGIQATRLIKKRYPQIRIVMLTTFQDRQNIQLALQAGAEGYLLKTDRLTDMAQKLRLLLTGTAILNETVLRQLATPQIDTIEKLTPREREVLNLVAQGFTNKEIGQHLFLSEGTVRNMVSVIMEKAGVKNRTQLSLMMK